MYCIWVIFQEHWGWTFTTKISWPISEEMKLEGHLEFIHAIFSVFSGTTMIRWQPRAKSHWFLTRPNSSPNLVHCQKPRAIRAALDGGVPGITRLSPWISAACSWVPQVILTSLANYRLAVLFQDAHRLQHIINITTIELYELCHHHCRIDYPNTPNIIPMRFARYSSAPFPHSPTGPSPSWPSYARAEADRHQIRLRSSQEQMIYTRQGLRSNRLLEDGHLRQRHPPGMCRKVVVFQVEIERKTMGKYDN